MDPVHGIEAKDWIEAIERATTHIKHASRTPRHKTSGLLDVKELPFSEQSFKDIAKRFYIHDSINRVVSQAAVSQFSAVKVDMGRQDGRCLPAQVYNARTSNAWQGDLAVSSTYFPHCNLTFAVMFGCTLSVEAEILTRLEMATYEICHPLLISSMLIEIERKRHMPIVNNTLDELEGRILELDEDPEFLQHITETEKVSRKNARRLAWLDMQYLRNQLLSWSTCLEAFYEHTDYLNRTIFRDMSSPNPEADWYDSIDEISLVDGQQFQDVSHHATVVFPEPQIYKYQEVLSVRLRKSYMRRTGAKMRWRLREIMKEYNEKIRECTTGYEGNDHDDTMGKSSPLTPSFRSFAHSVKAQGETNVEIALATSQDSRHMRSIALVTMIFLPGTFFASIFSMGFFEWKSDDGTISVAQSFWIYVVLAAGFTAFTVGAWWYIGVYRHKSQKNLSSARSGSFLLSLRPFRFLRGWTVKATMAKVKRMSPPP
ncbi:hypothetical protein FCIRC_5864 [Fusarium circinatum]|uniref:Uncharacterized protein n=1 Tax=Fusarium circinatum TaxID=48490 RepID=A0A8H5TXG5_FUSCI|nr:hypothetical protein FCIRC_5864 [Fusarium circinatum]